MASAGPRDAVFADQDLQLGQPAGHHLLVRQCAVFDNGRGGLRVEPVIDKLLGGDAGGAERHVENQRLTGVCEGGPVGSVIAGRGMAADEGDRTGMVAMGERNAAGSGAAGSSGDSRHDGGFDPSAPQIVELFAAAAKYERVAPFEPDDNLALLCLANEQCVDSGLRHRVMVLALADEDLAAQRIGQRENGVADQPVVD